MSLNTNVQGKKFSPLTLSLSDFLVQQLDQLGHFLTKHKEKDTLPTLTSIFSEALTARSRIVIAQTRPTSPLAENGDCIRIQIWHFQWSVEPWRGHPDLWPYFFVPIHRRDLPISESDNTNTLDGKLHQFLEVTFHSFPLLQDFNPLKFKLQCNKIALKFCVFVPHIIHMSFQKRYWNSQWTIMSTSTEAHTKYLNLELGTRLLLDLPPPASRDSPPLSPPESTKLDFLEETLCSWFESVPASRTLTWKWRRNWMWRGAGFLTLRWKSCFLSDF